MARQSNIGWPLSKKSYRLSFPQPVRLEAAKASLGAIVAPTNQPMLNVNVELKAGYVIDLSERGQPEHKIIGGAVVDATAEPVAGIGPDGHERDD